MMAFNVRKLQANWTVEYNKVYLKMSDVCEEVNRDLTYRRSGYGAYKDKCVINIQSIYGYNKAMKKMVNITDEVLYQKACFFVVELRHPIHPL